MIEWAAWDTSSRATVSRGPHVMVTRKRLKWAHCARCGLIALRNDVTRVALRRECVVLVDAP